MESASPLSAFPLLDDPKTYVPWTIPFRTEADSEKELTGTERTWIRVFRNSIPSFKKRASEDDSVEDAPAKAERFAKKYDQFLNDFESDIFSHGGPPNPILLCRLRELALREVGFDDIFKKVKAEENAKALTLLPDVLKTVDDLSDEKERVERVVKGVLAGNVFDLGAPGTIEMFDKGVQLSFDEQISKLASRPWVIDDLDEFKAAWMEKRWRKCVIFCDNSGADIALGVIPLVREMAKCGVQVVLAANEQPSINDITYNELLDLVTQVQEIEDLDFNLSLDNGHILMVSSGSDIPVADLGSVSQEVSFFSEGCDLLIMEGMGRSIETNLYTKFKCDTLHIGMVKHQEVAEFLNGHLYDCVVKFKPGTKTTQKINTNPSATSTPVHPPSGHQSSNLPSISSQ